ncbi:hypothetical protein H6G80_18765 [Nostoc sp. FACHB-87]|nr:MULTISPECIES: hypothetical protein [Nostocales]MBD2456111.1 hypothetical protein [Nostoc sp. FACHB-87]MBD2473862.1 hypothetical protein [Anabaena sp. FACHB-83]MBD2490516.1 hypothetical protein [Aulosira sp. FACHB-615]
MVRGFNSAGVNVDAHTNQLVGVSSSSNQDVDKLDQWVEKGTVVEILP